MGLWVRSPATFKIFLTEKQQNETLDLQSLTNWGRTPVYPDMIADDNSIVISVWYQVTIHQNSRPCKLQYFSRIYKQAQIFLKNKVSHS
jgi:hypothetical protein